MLIVTRAISSFKAVVFNLWTRSISTIRDVKYCEVTQLQTIELLIYRVRVSQLRCELGHVRRIDVQL